MKNEKKNGDKRGVGDGGRETRDKGRIAPLLPCHVCTSLCPLIPPRTRSFPPLARLVLVLCPPTRSFIPPRTRLSPPPLARLVLVLCPPRSPCARSYNFPCARSSSLRSFVPPCSPCTLLLPLPLHVHPRWLPGSCAPAHAWSSPALGCSHPHPFGLVRTRSRVVLVVRTHYYLFLS
jgi:hypothetical protein